MGRGSNEHDDSRYRIHLPEIVSHSEHRRLLERPTASSPASSDNDTFSGSTPAKPDTTTYTYSNTTTPTSDPLVGRFTIDPFKDTSNSNTLADVAAYYWKTDLRSTLDNKVSPSARDPAFWQHLVTFTVGLGITGTGTVTKTSDGSIADLSTQASRDLLVTNKTALNWTTPSDNDPRTGDDLIHAAMNGRGRYFPAPNPTELANGLATALSEVGDQALDQAPVTVDSSKVAAGGKLYQATFSPSKWYGRVYAFTRILPLELSTTSHPMRGIRTPIKLGKLPT